MRAIMVVCALMLVCSAVASAIESNAGPVSTAPVPYHRFVDGFAELSIVVYDDTYNSYVQLALADLGLAYDLYYSDYAGFETAVQSGAYDLIIVDHAMYFELSNAWDDIYAELLQCKKAIIATFDCDASNDYSGYMDDIVAFAGHEWNHGIDPAINIWGWIASPFWAGVSNPAVPTGGYYADDGDALWGSVPTSIAGWVQAPTNGEIAINYVTCKLIFGCLIWDNYATADAVQWWKNSIQYMCEHSPVEKGTWSSIKAMYQ